MVLKICNRFVDPKYITFFVKKAGNLGAGFRKITYIASLRIILKVIISPLCEKWRRGVIYKLKLEFGLNTPLKVL